jgi:hypothetical protein
MVIDLFKYHSYSVVWFGSTRRGGGGGGGGGVALPLSPQKITKKIIQKIPIFWQKKTDWDQILSVVASDYNEISFVTSKKRRLYNFHWP